MVAPLAGARIEIQRMKAQKGDHYVAPLAGARIEIDFEKVVSSGSHCRSPRGSAD